MLLLSCSSRFHSIPIASGKDSYVKVNEATSCIWAPEGPHGSSLVASRTWKSIWDTEKLPGYFRVPNLKYVRSKKSFSILFYLWFGFCVVHYQVCGFINHFTNLPHGHNIVQFEIHFDNRLIKKLNFKIKLEWITILVYFVTIYKVVFVTIKHFLFAFERNFCAFLLSRQ